MIITEVTPVLSGHRVLVKIATDDGLVGWGEGSGFLPHAVLGLVEELRPYLLGEDASRINFLWQEVFRRPFVRGGPITGSAVAAIDLALWDLKGHAMDAPVYQLLGGAARDRVRVYGHVHADTAEEIAAKARVMAERGIQVIRYRGFIDTDKQGVHDHAAGVRQQIEFTEAIRDAVGPDVDLILECHGRYDPAWAVKLIKAVERFEPLFVEDPIRHEHPGGYRQLRAASSVPLATGERGHSKWELRELIENRLVDYLRPDVCWAGGITEMMKIASFAETYLINMVPHNIQGPLGSAATLHASMAIPNLTVMEAALYAGREVVEGDIRPWPTVLDGHALPPAGPGLGVTVDEGALPGPLPPRGGHPRLRALDGSARDW